MSSAGPKAYLEPMHHAIGKATMAFSGLDIHFAMMLQRLARTDLDAAGVIFFTIRNVDTRLEIIKTLNERVFRSNTKHVDVNFYHEITRQILETIIDKFKRKRQFRNTIAHGNLYDVRTKTGLTCRLAPSIIDPTARDEHFDKLDKKQQPGHFINDVNALAASCRELSQYTGRFTNVLDEYLRGGPRHEEFQRQVRILANALQIPFHPPQQRQTHSETSRPPQSSEE